jgi:hypothetical protein
MTETITSYEQPPEEIAQTDDQVRDAFLLLYHCRNP